ncbi:MAG: hypothetical protein WD875_05085 [Pirellulales bacterium]
MFVVLFALPSAIVNGQNIFFSEVGMPVLENPTDALSPYVAPMPLTVADVPVIDMLVGETRTLHVWINLNDLPSAESILSVALDVESSHLSVAHPLDFVVSDPWNRTFGRQRWTGVVNGALGSAESRMWLTNARAIHLSDSSNQFGVGMSNDEIIASGDSGHDSHSGSFYLGELDFHADGRGRTGLYFRTGDIKTMIQRPGSTFVPAQLHYGGNVLTPPIPGDMPGGGDPITSDLMYADAIINVRVAEPSAALLAACGTFSLLSIHLLRQREHRRRGTVESQCLHRPGRIPAIFERWRVR